MSPGDKPLTWLAGEIKAPPFGPEARLEAGFLLRRLQSGAALSLPHSRPMPGIGKACHELRVNDRDATWRILYYVDAEAIVILEVFSKKRQATPKKVIEACQKRLEMYRRSRG
jgi:phage-related protein